MAITLHTWDTRGKPALERIIGEVFPENLASARVLEVVTHYELRSIAVVDSLRM